MSYRISILDKSPLAAGETAAQALARTLTLAQHAEARGYHRFWVAEHHNTDQLASPSPELVIARCWATPGGSVLGPAASCSSTIAPIRSRKTLTCWPPSRRAASISGSARRGGLPLSTRALQQGLHQEEKGTFADQLAQLDNWLSLTEPGERRAYAPRRSRLAGQMVFARRQPESAELAARLDWNFVFAAHLNGDSALRRAVFNRWRELSPREAMVAVQWWSLTIRPPPPRWRSRSRCGASSWRTASG